MRRFVEISDDEIATLDALAEQARKPRAFIISAAIEEYVTKNVAKLANDDKFWIDEPFGLWAKRGFNEDGLVYEQRLRDE